MRPHAADDGRAPPALSAAERSDLVAFLRTLSVASESESEDKGCDR
ncbi:MAG: hypothetical protein ACJ8G1_19560 [Vitreoscilla sp.]